MTHKDLLGKIKKINEKDPFLITITVFTGKKIKGQELETFVFKNRFPSEELEGTKAVIGKLIDRVK